MLEEIEDLLVASTWAWTRRCGSRQPCRGRMGRRLSVPEIKDILAAEVARIMEGVARPMPLFPKKPQVVLVVGVNGSARPPPSASSPASSAPPARRS
jgi:fused signal recognition particle receptor